MVDRELIARFNRRVDMAQHLERIRELHEAQKAGLTGSSLFVAVRHNYPPESLDKTRQFIEKHRMT